MVRENMHFRTDDNFFKVALTFRLPRGGGIHSLRIFAYHTCWIWN